MNDERFEKLGKDVNYLNEEGFAGEGQQFMLFRNADDAIEAIRNNQIPGIVWDEEDEAKWQASLAIDKVLGGEEIDTICDEFNDGNLDASEWKSGTVEEFFDDIFQSGNQQEGDGPTI